jgi:hypothetical protein
MVKSTSPTPGPTRHTATAISHPALAQLPASPLGPTFPSPPPCLTSHRSRPPTPHPQDGHTPLTSAACQGHTEISAVLIAAKADLEAKDKVRGVVGDCRGTLRSGIVGYTCIRNSEGGRSSDEGCALEACRLERCRDGCGQEEAGRPEEREIEGVGGESERQESRGLRQSFSRILSPTFSCARLLTCSFFNLYLLFQIKLKFQVE